MWGDDLEPLAKITHKVFMDVTGEKQDGPAGRIILGLYGDLAPKTVANFRALCTGEAGKTYKGSPFHRIFYDFMIQGGDIENGDGTGGSSIYGEKFPDENTELYFDRPGLLAMANSGPDTNGSQFFVTTAAAQWLDGEHVIFGEVVEGREVVLNIEGCASQSGEPLQRVTVADCGAL